MHCIFFDYQDFQRFEVFSKKKAQRDAGIAVNIRPLHYCIHIAIKLPLVISFRWLIWPDEWPEEDPARLFEFPAFSCINWPRALLLWWVLESSNSSSPEKWPLSSSPLNRNIRRSGDFFRAFWHPMTNWKHKLQE